VNAVPDLNKATAIAAPDQTKAAAAPRIKLLPHGFSIDHPDPEHGERLMSDALGVSDRDAMHGILRQLVKASVNGERPDEVNLSFMISMVKSIKPRDSVEAMLVAQMQPSQISIPSSCLGRNIRSSNLIRFSLGKRDDTMNSMVYGIVWGGIPSLLFKVFQDRRPN